MGAGSCDAQTAMLAEEVGRLIAGAGAVLICGGGTGVMEAASRGASRAGGLVAEHETNASTFACRVIVGTESDLYSAVVAGIGPHHRAVRQQPAHPATSPVCGPPWTQPHHLRGLSRGQPCSIRFLRYLCEGARAAP